MHDQRSKKVIMDMAEKYQLPPALIKHRLMIGFPPSCMGATDLDNVTYSNGTFEQEPYIPAKTPKKTSDAVYPPRHMPPVNAPQTDVKIIRKRSRLKK